MNIIKKFLHTKYGSFVGFSIGLKGFNKLEVWKNGKKIGPSYNSRVDTGAALTASLMSGTTLGGISSPQSVKYIALSTNTLTPAKGDTTLSGETSATGLARTTGTSGTYTAPASLDGSASYVLTHTFTNTSGGSVTVVSAAIFDASSSGNMFVEANLSSSVTLANGDNITINWTINV